VSRFGGVFQQALRASSSAAKPPSGGKADASSPVFEVAEPISHGEDARAVEISLSPTPRPPRGKRPNVERRRAILAALTKQGEQWRDHLPEIFKELDADDVGLGHFHGKRIDIGDGQTSVVWKWEDLDLAEGDDRARIIDALRKYRD
jgi:hypothetical protein